MFIYIYIGNRHKYSAEQLEILEEEFEINENIQGDAKLDLAARVGASKEQITRWFASKRKKTRK